MAKLRNIWVCQNCGAEALQYFGRCSDCQSWGSLVEQAVSPVVSVAGGARLISGRKPKPEDPAQPLISVTLSQITDTPHWRFSSGFGELDRVLGGGIVPGSLVLVGGDPGIGKSTLLLQMMGLLHQQQRVLYVCAEESSQQVKLRAQRLGMVGDTLSSASGLEDLVLDTSGLDTSELNSTANLYLLPETDLELILQELTSLKPQVAVIDSIQAIYLSTLTSAPGSVAQVRECTSALMRLAKRDHISLFIVGHVTKDGAIAGPKVLEHLVDTVLYFEGDRFASHRLLRSVKNRFGATHEIGVFEMIDRGLQEVTNPSALFLGDRTTSSTGTATIVACEGTRPIVVELQALVSPTSYSSPRRSTTGIEYNRLLQILAVLEKRLGIPLSKLDAYVASSGGLTVAEPAADLGVAIAVVASFRDRVVDPLTVLIGEVGLGGQVRSVSQLELRLKEAAKLGFQRAIVPKGQLLTDVGLEIIPVARVADAIVAALPGRGHAAGPEIEEAEE
jgi:DNA repair protein RadA/Sms